jgi:molecular chaperone GrpE
MQNDETPVDAVDTAPAEEALRRERDELYERLLRVTAEFDNYRKRTERERREWADAAAADVIRDILPVLDDLERALTASAEAGAPDALHKGVKLIHRQLLDALRRHGVEPIEAIGRDFDPEWHESVAYEPAGDRRDGEVIGEVRRGYKMGSRLLRAAMVRVAKA